MIGQIKRAEAAAHRTAVNRRNEKRWPNGGQQRQTYDALTRQILDSELVKAGKAAEMDFLRQWTVYEYATYAEAMAETGRKPISTKWVCTNKGDDTTPNVRCRWVARESCDDQDVLFAATAPYESIKLLLSLAATKEESGKVGEQRVQIAMIRFIFGSNPLVLTDQY